jgi:hypothetical protein
MRPRRAPTDPDAPTQFASTARLAEARVYAATVWGRLVRQAEQRTPAARAALPVSIKRSHAANVAASEGARLAPLATAGIV